MLRPSNDCDSVNVTRLFNITAGKCFFNGLCTTIHVVTEQVQFQSEGTCTVISLNIREIPTFIPHQCYSDEQSSVMNV